jgi:hypothetical protein
MRDLLDIGRAGCVFATNVAANGPTAGCTVVKSMISIAVVVPTTIAKVLDVIIDEHQHGRCLCKIVALTPVVVLAAAMTASPVNKCCQKRGHKQGNEVAGNGAHQGLLPGCIIVIGVVVGSVVVMVGSFNVARTIDVPVSASPLSLPAVVASSRLLPAAALLSSPLVGEEGGLSLPPLLYPLVPLPCCHGPTLVVFVVFDTPKFSNIAAGQFIVVVVGRTTGRRCQFCCRLVASLHCNNCGPLPIQTYLLLPTTTISTIAAAGITIAIAVLAGRLAVMSFSHDYSICVAVV